MKAPYGSWKSPLTAGFVAGQALRLREPRLIGGDLYWLEGRPQEGGREILVRRRAGKIQDVTPAGFNVRTRVHEYGGGSYTAREETVLFSNDADSRLYRIQGSSPPAPLTVESLFGEGKRVRFADGVLNRAGWSIWVAEIHEGSGPPENCLVRVGAEGDVTRLHQGYDFYSNPRLSPDGRQLAWLCWNQPQMPWDGCELWSCALSPDGSQSNARRVAGSKSESLFQPEWSPEGRLYVVSDRSGWWNLHRVEGSELVPVHSAQQEFGSPLWHFRYSTYGFLSEAKIFCTFTQRGRWRLGIVDTLTGGLTELADGGSEFDYVTAENGVCAYLAIGPLASPAVVVREGDRTEIVRAVSMEGIDPSLLSVAEAIEFPTTEGAAAHAFYYPPRNPAFEAPAGEKPPCLVVSHGGPTGSTSTGLSLNYQFWTSRGFALLDVNYRGSTGYGRPYRDALNGKWGVYDVDDCVEGALSLVKRGLADRQRLAIRGGSAGGYTTLCALVFRKVFGAGASYFGVSDIEVLAKDTHKFEARYDEQLVATGPNKLEVYRARSPIHFVGQLECPLILLQGLEDKVVPPNQAEMFFEAMKKKGLPVAYLPFMGEGHGFRKPESLIKSLEAELYFYSRIFNFTPADPLTPIRIENLSSDVIASVSLGNARQPSAEE